MSTHEIREKALEAALRIPHMPDADSLLVAARKIEAYLSGNDQGGSTKPVPMPMPYRTESGGTSALRIEGMQ